MTLFNEETCQHLALLLTIVDISMAYCKKKRSSASFYDMITWQCMINTMILKYEIDLYNMQWENYKDMSISEIQLLATIFCISVSGNTVPFRFLNGHIFLKFTSFFINVKKI